MIQIEESKMLFEFKEGQVFRIEPAFTVQASGRQSQLHPQAPNT